ncbi:MAG: hypothetical protein H0U27_03090 [Nitrosopumilus sp.]|nr:hypothetical protein [Nitrosopumilus sp.]
MNRREIAYPHCKPPSYIAFKNHSNRKYLKNHIFLITGNKLVNDNSNNKNGNYDKIKHLVEVDDDILAVFIVMSSQIRDLYIAKGARTDRAYINSIYDTLGLNNNNEATADGEKGTDGVHNPLGKLKWVVLEHENLRVLKIIEKDKIVVVLVNSNTQLQHTIDNILGYYYDLDEAPKSLF